VKRPVPNSWSSPIVVSVGASEQVITCGSPWVIAYDPATGAELWRCDVLSGDVAPTPVFAGGRVFAANTGSNVAAIRPDRRGNVTRSAVLWKAQDGLPDMVSPVSDGDLTLLVSSTLATCYDARTGAKLWEQEFGAPFRSSPTLVGKRAYLADTEGVTHVMELSRTPRILRANPLGEPINASPAFVKGRIFVRGKQSLYCLGGRRG
jgi:outer membrane protein assembly factor BamB